MKIKVSRRFRYWFVSLVAGNPSAIKSFIFRATIFFTLIVIFVPPRVGREIVYGTSARKPDLKTSLRSMLWLWNRSWIPLRHPLVTYFDIGWLLSEQSSEALQRRGFLSKQRLKRKCDLAQYQLSSIRAAFEADDQPGLIRADREMHSQTTEVFYEANDWVGSAQIPEKAIESTAQHGSNEDASRDEGFDNAATRAALLDFDRLCKNVGQEYFLVSGTFLGVVRDNAFIGHDNDIDLGVFEDALLTTLVPALEDSADFAVTKVDYICMRHIEAGAVRYQTMEKPAIIKMFHRSGVAIDLFVHFYDGDVTWHGSSMHRWDNSSFELKDYEFLDTMFKGAVDFDRYLSENYGPDWRIPKPDFDSLIDTPNLRFTGSANSLVFWSWMVAQAVLSKDPVRVRNYLDYLSAQGVIQAPDQSSGDTPQPLLQQPD